MLLSLTLAVLSATLIPTPAVFLPGRLLPDEDTALITAKKDTASDAKKSVTYEVVELTTSDKLTLTANYYAPKTKSGKAPAAIIIHEAGQDRSQCENLAKYLQRKGIGVLVPDLRGHGASTNKDLDWKSLNKNSRETAWAFSLRDIKCAASFLRGRREIHASNLTLMGIGSGAALAVRHAIDDDNARAVVLLGPGANNYGFNLVSNVTDLEGLPALIVSPSDERDNASRIQNAAHKANDFEYIEVSVVRSKGKKFLGDKKLSIEVYTWLKGQVMPKR